jgi:hypothetical protein
MKLLTKAHMSQRRLIEILRVIESAGLPVGARAISDSLCNRGYDLGERAVRYNLRILDELGFTKKRGYSGRVITPLGSRELTDALVDDRIGFVNTRIEEYMFKTSFDPRTGRGDVVANTSIIDKANAEEVFDILDRAFEAGYTVSQRVLIVDEGDNISSRVIPAGSLGVATVCSITLDGMLLKKGIPVLTSFAGLAEVREKQPAEFIDLRQDRHSILCGCQRPGGRRGDGSKDRDRAHIYAGGPLPNVIAEMIARPFVNFSPDKIRFYRASISRLKLHLH